MYAEHEVINMAMNELIKALRQERGMTQLQLAQRLHVSDKAVSKWETGAGCPDVTLVPALAQLLGISAETLLAGELPKSQRDVGSMKHLQVYKCPVCGNVLTTASPADIVCCGRKLSPLGIQPANAAHALHLEPVEGQWLVSFDHPMEKQHHLLFLLEIGFDSFSLLRLYPEGPSQVRMPRLPGGKFFCACTAENVLFRC